MQKNISKHQSPHPLFLCLWKSYSFCLTKQTNIMCTIWVLLPISIDRGMPGISALTKIKTVITSRVELNTRMREMLQGQVKKTKKKWNGLEAYDTKNILNKILGRIQRTVFQRLIALNRKVCKRKKVKLKQSLWVVLAYVNPEESLRAIPAMPGLLLKPWL